MWTTNEPFLTEPLLDICSVLTSVWRLIYKYYSFPNDAPKGLKQTKTKAQINTKSTNEQKRIQILPDLVDLKPSVLENVWLQHEKEVIGPDYSTMVVVGWLGDILTLSSEERCSHRLCCRIRWNYGTWNATNAQTYNRNTK